MMSVKAGSVGNGSSLSHEQAPSSEPLQPSGILERFTYDDVTPVIGREFPHLNVVDDMLNSPDADALIRDLAITSKVPLLNSV